MHNRNLCPVIFNYDVGQNFTNNCASYLISWAEVFYRYVCHLLMFRSISTEELVTGLDSSF